jgi:hypothetical protein
LSDFNPQNAIEHRILAARSGDVTGDTLMLEIAATDIFIPSDTLPAPDGSGFAPILLEQQDGTCFVAVFTAAPRAAILSPHVMQAPGANFLRRVPQGYGVIVNPGTDAQIFLPPDGVAALQHDLKAP